MLFTGIMEGKFKIIIVYILITGINIRYCKGTPCNDVRLASDNIRPNGIYSIDNGSGDYVKIYCLFYEGFGYAFVSKTTSVPIDISMLMDDTSHVIVRHKRIDGHQYTATIKQLESFSHIPISVQFNSHAGYNSPKNTALFPYIYVGFIPISHIKVGEKNGWVINNSSLTFSNCDGNSNSYLAILFNHNKVSYTGPSDSYNPLMFSWYTLATEVSHEEILPDEFFTSFLEIHHGGCGGYSTASGVPEVTGAAIGVKFLITCGVPNDIGHGNKFYMDTKIGSNVTYTCDTGYILVAGNLIRECTINGRWSGTSPSCKELENVAFVGKAYQTDTSCCGGGGADLAVDGGMSQYWEDGSCSLTETGVDAYWEIDLGNQYIIHHVTILSRLDQCCDSHLRHVKMYMGTSRATYNLVDYYPEVINSTNTFYMDHTTHARWIKITRDSSVQEQLSLCEVQIMGHRPEQMIYKKRFNQIGTGKVLIVSSSVSNIDCCRQCFRYPGCLGVNFHLDTSQCYLLDSWSVASSENSNIVFYISYYMFT